MGSKLVLMARRMVWMVFAGLLVVGLAAPAQAQDETSAPASETAATESQPTDEKEDPNILDRLKDNAGALGGASLDCLKNLDVTSDKCRGVAAITANPGTAAGVVADSDDGVAAAPEAAPPGAAPWPGSSV